MVQNKPQISTKMIFLNQLFKSNIFLLVVFRILTSLSIMLALTVFCFPVNFYTYIFSLTLNRKFLKFLFTGSPTETNTLGRHFENICINWLFSDTEWSQGTRIYFLLCINISMISTPASSEIRLFGFEV